MKNITNTAILAATKNWIRSFVIEYQLCPFAKRPFDLQQIRYRLTNTTDINVLTKIVLKEFLFLDQTETEKIETTLIILPNLLSDFLDFNDYCGWLEDLIDQEQDLRENFQLASFHPHFQFANTTPEDLTNRTNQSPFPLLHILRSESVENAIDQYGDTTTIPERNIQLMHQMFQE